MSNKVIDWSDFESECENIFKEFTHAQFKKRQTALQAGAEVLVKRLEAASPKSSSNNSDSYSGCWKISSKYKNMRVVGNTKIAKPSKAYAGKRIPLSNILEYGERSPHRGLIRRTFEESKEEIFQAIKRTLDN